MKTGELLPHFPELLPLDQEKEGNGARIMEIREVLQKEGYFRQRRVTAGPGRGYSPGPAVSGLKRDLRFCILATICENQRHPGSKIRVPVSLR